MRLPRARSGFRLALPAAAIWTFACATASKPPEAASGEGADLAAVVEGIQQALREAGSRPVAGFPPWKSVTVKLQTEATRSAGGEIQVYVVSLGSRYTAESVSSIELKMVPPDEAALRGLRPAGELHEALARAIHLAQVGAAKAAGGDPAFAVARVEIDLKFGVEVSGAGGAKVAFVPLAAEVSAKLGKNQVQTITLVFEN
jgi:hypothetical protein